MNRPNQSHYDGDADGLGCCRGCLVALAPWIILAIGCAFAAGCAIVIGSGSAKVDGKVDARGEIDLKNEPKGVVDDLPNAKATPRAFNSEQTRDRVAK